MYLTQNTSVNKKQNVAKNKKNKHGFTNKHTEKLYSELNTIFTEWRTSSTMTENTLDQKIKSVFDKCQTQEENQELFKTVDSDLGQITKPFIDKLGKLVYNNYIQKRASLKHSASIESSTALFAREMEQKRKTFTRPKKKPVITASNPTDDAKTIATEIAAKKNQINIQYTNDNKNKKNASSNNGAPFTIYRRPKHAIENNKNDSSNNGAPFTIYRRPKHAIENNKNDSSNNNNLYLVKVDPIDTSDDEPASVPTLKKHKPYPIYKRPMYDISDYENNSDDESTSANESSSDDEFNTDNDNKNKKKYNTASGKLLGLHQDIENQNITVEQRMDSNYIKLSLSKFKVLEEPYNNLKKAYLEAKKRKDDNQKTAELGANTIDKEIAKIKKQNKKNKGLVADSLNHVQNKMIDLAKQIQALCIDQDTKLTTTDAKVLEEVKDLLAQHSQNIYADFEQYVASFRFQPNSSIKGSSLGKIKKKTGGNKYDITLNTTSFDTDTINDSYGTIETAFDTIAEQFDTTKAKSQKKEKSQNMFNNFFNKK
ncbi:MAG: hypothetical protein GY730_02685 [bacterium]|nr:hypothetical protein [bacterium]